MERGERREERRGEGRGAMTRCDRLPKGIRRHSADGNEGRCITRDWMARHDITQEGATKRDTFGAGDG